MLHAFTNKLKVFEIEKAMGCQLAKTQHNEIVKLFIEPCGEITEHSLPVHVTFFVIRGTGLVSVNQKEHRVAKGDVFEVEPQLMRAWKNNSSQALEVLVIKQI